MSDQCNLGGGGEREREGHLTWTMKGLYITAVQNGCQGPLFSPLSDTFQSHTRKYSICMLQQRGGRARPHATLDNTVTQKRKWKCHVNVFVMQ